MKQIFIKKNSTTFGIGLLFFIAGALFSVGITKFTEHSTQIQNSKSARETVDTDLISPLLLCAETKNSFQVNELTKQVTDYIGNKKDSKTVSDISFYYRDLREGTWTSVNEEDLYAPASMLKVPVMMAIFKKAESNPSILSKQISFKENNDLNQGEAIKPSKSISSGASYSVSNLISYMIEYSDNNATTLLLDAAEVDTISKLFTDLGLPSAGEVSGTKDYLSVRSYAHFFRTLYNATYLNQEFSMKALELLTKSDFKNGIRSSVPNSIKVADKFGERTIWNDDGTMVERELHDCGIVYTRKPYLLCIMTKGADFSSLESVVSTLSAFSYKYATTNNI